MKPSPAEVAELADIALVVAREGAELAKKGFRAPKRVSHKGAIDLVTEYDTAVEALILDRLAEEAGHVPIVAEEGGGNEGKGLTFYVDPIDGTTNYAHGHPFWCVSIGVVDANGFPLAGAVVAPALHLEWTAFAGGPSRRNGEACRVSSVDDISEALLATGFPYDRRTSPDNNFAEFVAAKKRAQGVRRCGSAALDLCLVADGTYDGYWESKLKPWDFAAGAALVVSAGGVICDRSGGPADVRRGNLIATNGKIHDALFDLLARVNEEKSRLI